MIARRISQAVALCLLLAAFLYAANPQVDLSQYDFRDGDIVFQHWSNRLGNVICDVTESPLSHCGMIVHRNGEPQVIEAVGPVRYIALAKWMKQGQKQHFTQMRLRDVSKEQIAKTIKVAESMLGVPYDIQYELDDEKIYCSELVYKAYLRGAKISVGEIQKLGDLNWKPNEAFIREITGGDLPLEREMVSPASVARSSKLKLIYSTFPSQADEPLYDQNAIAGKWSGSYSVKRHQSAAVNVEFGPGGTFASGTIRLKDGESIAIQNISIDPFESKRDFVAKLHDERGIQSELHARILEKGSRLIGEWTDNRDNSGLFSIEKMP